MTSDRGNSGAAELQLTTTPTSVTQKSPGLNPNATEFLSKQDVHHWDDINAGLCQYVNGDINKLEVGSGVFPPAAASEPPLQPISAEFTPTATGPGSLLTASPAPPPAAAADQTVSTINTGPAAAAAGGGAGTGSPSAGTIIGTTGITTTSSPLIYSTQTETATLQDESPAQVEGTLSDEQIRRMLKSQLEYYFSRENLTSDTYLMSQMDADQYVAISAVASFSQVQRLTSNLELVVDVLRECQNVQVDEKGEKVRPNHNRCIVILREIPATTPVEEVENLFSGSNCPKFVSCEFAHNDSWYVTFDSDEDAQRAYQYLREEVKSFLGKPIMARIKAKPLIRPSYIPRNGLKPHFEQQTFPSPQRYAFLPNLQYGQQVLFHHGPAVLSSWAPAAPTIMDPSMQVFAMNGYQAAGVKINAPGRHQFTNIRVSRTPKPHRLNQERSSSDSRLSHDRQQNPNAHRSSPRSTENAHVTAAPFLQRKSSDNSSHHNHPLHHIQHSNTSGGGSGVVVSSSGGITASVPVHHNSAAPESSTSMSVSLLSDSSKDSPASQPQSRKLYNKGRRKKDEDYSKLSRQNPSQISANKYTEPQFEFESNSFPPLPGSQNNAASGEKFENKLSDVVRGTAKPLAKESVITSPVVAATASSSSSSSTSSPSSSTTGAGTSGTTAAAVVAAAAPMSTSSTSAAVGLNTQPPPPPPPPASKEVSTAVATSMLAPSSSTTTITTTTTTSSTSSAAVVNSPAAPASTAVVMPATAPTAPHLPLIATTSTLSLSPASATSANNRTTLAQTSQPVCPANKPSCAIPSAAGNVNRETPSELSKSADSHPVSLVGGSQPHSSAAAVTSPPTAAAAVATTTTASPKETSVRSALSTPSTHTPPASSSSQSQSVSSSSSLPLSSSSGHGPQAPAAGAASSSSSSSSSSTQQGHTRPGQTAPPQGMTSSSSSSSATAASTSPAALTAASVSNALQQQQQQQSSKMAALEDKSTSKLSYAQMVARKRDPGNDCSALSVSDKSQAATSQQQTPTAAQQQPQAHSAAGDPMCKMSNNLLQPTGSGSSQRSQALKEQSQALKVSSLSATHSQLPPKEHILRKDLEPKEQRFNLSGKRPAKENRERQRRKTDRERTSK